MYPPNTPEVTPLLIAFTPMQPRDEVAAAILISACGYQPDPESIQSVVKLAYANGRSPAHDLLMQFPQARLNFLTQPTA